MQPFTILPATGGEQVDEWVRLGIEAQVAGKFPDAQRYYARALRLDPCHATATHNLGIVLAQNGNLNEGLLAMERAALFDGVEPLIASNRALMNLEADRLEDAKAAAEYALGLAKDPPPAGDALKTAGYLGARLAYAMIAAAAGEPGKALPVYREMLAVDPKHPAAGPNACFVQSLMPVGPAELLEQRRAWYAANRFQGRVFPHLNDRTPDRTLRVGYVGGDFKSHSAAMMFAHVLFNHDPAQVAAYLYSSLPTNPEADDLTAKFRAAGEWREIAGKTDEEVAELIQSDAIDILVDLAGHTNGGRLAVFTRKPAPVQVTAWGFAHGTGVTEVDYFFADPVALPEAERPAYAERIFDLPCIVTYRPPEEYGIRATSPLPFYKNEYVTFGSFSRYEKLSEECLACFAEILRGVPDSRLYLKDHAYRRPYSIRRVLKALDGIDRKRVLFGTSTSHPEHMLEYQTADIILDPHPHGGGVVSMETLYAGVPLITKYGTQPAGRTASSVLTAMGRTDWIARTDAEYVAKAVEWANRPQDLAKARKTLREELLASPVVSGYPRAVEAAYRALWKEWVAK